LFFVSRLDALSDDYSILRFVSTVFEAVRSEEIVRAFFIIWVLRGALDQRLRLPILIEPSASETTLDIVLAGLVVHVNQLREIEVIFDMDQLGQLDFRLISICLLFVDPLNSFFSLVIAHLPVLHYLTHLSV
jgi:hypothetical protein